MFKTISRCIMVRRYLGKLLLGSLNKSQICALSTAILQCKTTLQKSTIKKQNSCEQFGVKNDYVPSRTVLLSFATFTCSPRFCNVRLINGHVQKKSFGVIKNCTFGNSLVSAQTSATVNQKLLSAKNCKNVKKKYPSKT